MTISLAARSCSMEPVERGGAASEPPQYPSSSRRCSATWRVARAPWLRWNRYGHVQQRRALGELGPQPGQVHPTGAAQRDGQLRAGEDGTHRRPESRAERRLVGGLVELIEHRLLPAGEQLREHAVRDTAARSTTVSVGEPRRQLEGLVDRHLLRRGHDHHAGLRRVAEDLEHPPRLVPHQPDLHELLDRLGGRELAGDVTGGDGVDDDQVVAALAHLPQELADGEDLLDARRRVGHEVERASERTEPGDERDLQLEAQVLLERLLGVHRHREEARATPPAP